MLILLFLCTLLSQTLTSTSTVLGSNTFSFVSFSPESCTNGELLCMGSASAGNGFISLTPEPQQSNNSSSSTTANKVGRVLYPHPVHVWSAIISTTFTLRITPFSKNSTNSGDGMALIFAQDNRPSPNDSFGSYLGMFDRSTQGKITYAKYHCFKVLCFLIFCNAFIVVLWHCRRKVFYTVKKSQFDTLLKMAESKLISMKSHLNRDL